MSPQDPNPTKQRTYKQPLEVRRFKAQQQKLWRQRKKEKQPTTNTPVKEKTN